MTAILKSTIHWIVLFFAVSLAFSAFATEKEKEESAMDFLKGEPGAVKEHLRGSIASAGQGGPGEEQALIWPEEYQARVYRAQLDMPDKSTRVQGYAPWVLMDFRSHLRELNGIQDTCNRKGLVSETGKKKPAFAVLSAHYKKSKVGNKSQPAHWM